MIPGRVLEQSQVVQVEVEEASAFFADADRGSLLVYRLRLFGLPVHWWNQIVAWRPSFGFNDLRLRGPYRCWEFTHGLIGVDG